MCADNLQMTTNKFLFEYLRIVSGPNFVYSLSFVKKLKYVTLGADYTKKSYPVNQAGLHVMRNCSLVLHETFTSLERG